MHPLERELLTLCRNHGLFNPGDHAVVGVSGGPDSMALLHLLARLAPDLAITLVVAHVDHGLRPEAAGAEEGLVRAAAAGLGLECVVSHLAVAAHAKGHGLSVEEAARDLRYGFFDSVAQTWAAAKIVVAHTADDQAEEVLLRLIRGAGRKGLSGMTLLREGRVIRPLLTTEKARLLSYLEERGIPMAHDASNTDPRYLRNRIRLDLLPYLARFNPNIKETLRRTATILRDEDALLADLVEADYGRLVAEETEAGRPVATVICAPFNEQPIAIRRRLIERMLIRLGTKPGFRQIEGIIALAATDRGRHHLHHGLRASTEQGVMRLVYPWGSRAERGDQSMDAPLPFRLVVPRPGRYLIPELDQALTLEIIPQAPSLMAIRATGADLLDAGQVNFPLVVRSRLPGDRFHPMNSKGHKKVGDFLTDLKVPRRQRERVPILVSDHRIIALLGRRIDHGVRVTTETTEVLKVTLMPA